MNQIALDFSTPRETRNAHHKINREARETMRSKVLEFVMSSGNATNKEIANFLGVDVCSITGRVMELRKMELLRASHVRNCKITGNRVMCWCAL